MKQTNQGFSMALLSSNGLQLATPKGEGLKCFRTLLCGLLETRPPVIGRHPDCCEVFWAVCSGGSVGTYGYGEL